MKTYKYFINRKNKKTRKKRSKSFSRKKTRGGSDKANGFEKSSRLREYSDDTQKPVVSVKLTESPATSYDISRIIEYSLDSSEKILKSATSSEVDKEHMIAYRTSILRLLAAKKIPNKPFTNKELSKILNNIINPNTDIRPLLSGNIAYDLMIITILTNTNDKIEHVNKETKLKTYKHLGKINIIILEEYFLKPEYNTEPLFKQSVDELTNIKFFIDHNILEINKSEKEAHEAGEQLIADEEKSKELTKNSGKGNAVSKNSGKGNAGTKNNGLTSRGNTGTPAKSADGVSKSGKIIADKKNDKQNQTTTLVSSPLANEASASSENEESLESAASENQESFESVTNANEAPVTPQPREKTEETKAKTPVQERKMKLKAIKNMIEESESFPEDSSGLTEEIVNRVHVLWKNILGSKVYEKLQQMVDKDQIDKYLRMNVKDPEMNYIIYKNIQILASISKKLNEPDKEGGVNKNTIIWKGGVADALSLPIDKEPFDVKDLDIIVRYGDDTTNRRLSLGISIFIVTSLKIHGKTFSYYIPPDNQDIVKIAVITQESISPDGILIPSKRVSFIDIDFKDKIGEDKYLYRQLVNKGDEEIYFSFPPIEERLGEMIHLSRKYMTKLTSIGIPANVLKRTIEKKLEPKYAEKLTTEELQNDFRFFKKFYLRYLQLEEIMKKSRK
jgi:hypothetical protein